jgi:serine/threonine protein kinase
MKVEIVDSCYNEFVFSIQKYFKKSNKTIHKARNEIKIVSYNSCEYVIKSFKIPNFVNKIIYTFFRDSKAKKSYVNSIKIVDFVPKPIGYIEFRKFGLISDSYFISERFNYDFAIREVLLDKNFQNREYILCKFAQFTYNLHESNILHLDYSPGNILIQEEHYVFKIIDINRMSFKQLSLDQRMENFKMLWANDDDLTIIVKEYSKLVKESWNELLVLALNHSTTHKAKKNLKKRLKGKKVVD